MSERAYSVICTYLARSALDAEHIRKIIDFQLSEINVDVDVSTPALIVEPVVPDLDDYGSLA